MTGELNAPRTPLIKADTRWLKSPLVGVVFERHNHKVSGDTQASLRENSVEQAGTREHFARVANPMSSTSSNNWPSDVSSEENNVNKHLSYGFFT